MLKERLTPINSFAYGLISRGRNLIDVFSAGRHQGVIGSDQCRRGGTVSAKNIIGLET